MSKPYLIRRTKLSKRSKISKDYLTVFVWSWIIPDKHLAIPFGTKSIAEKVAKKGDMTGWPFVATTNAKYELVKWI